MREPVCVSCKKCQALMRQERHRLSEATICPVCRNDVYVKRLTDVPPDIAQALHALPAAIRPARAADGIRLTFLSLVLFSAGLYGTHYAHHNGAEEVITSWFSGLMKAKESPPVVAKVDPKPVAVVPPEPPKQPEQPQQSEKPQQPEPPKPQEVELVDLPPYPGYVPGEAF